MSISQEPEIVDTTDTAKLEAVDQPVAEAGKQADPAMSVVVALADELQKAYANDHQALESANRTLRAATKPPTDSNAPN